MGCHPLRCNCGPDNYFAQRYIMASLSLYAIIVYYGQRVSLSLAITQMTNKTASQSTSCPKRNGTLGKTRVQMEGGTLSWSHEEQNLILGAFYWGYAAGSIPGGFLSDFYGARYILIAGGAISTVCTAVQPIIAIKLPWYITCVLRCITGLGQSVLYPAISSLYGKWVPFEERSLLGSFSFAANALGCIFGNFLTGAMLQLVGHWHSAFYLWAAVGALWIVLFTMYVYSEPETHPFITEHEQSLLDAKITKGNKTIKFPWKMLIDPPVIGLMMGEIGHDFTIYTQLNSLPKYMSDVLHYNLAENSLASSLPYLGQWLGGLVSGRLADYVIKKKGFSVPWCRRIWATTGIVGPGALMVLIGYMGCDGTMVLVMFSLATLIKGPFFGSLKVNHLDITVNFPGILMAFVNGIGACTGFVSPSVINAIAHSNELNDWIWVFWIVFIVASVGDGIYVILLKTHRRKWDYGKDEVDEYYKDEAARKKAIEDKKKAKADDKKAKEEKKKADQEKKKADQEKKKADQEKKKAEKEKQKGKEAT